MKRFAVWVSFLLLLPFMDVPPCLAVHYEIKTKTPEIHQAFQGRKARRAQLRPLKQSGVIGENSRGYLANLKKDPAAEVLVQAENHDRGIIYRALVSQNALGPNGMQEVETAFAEVRRGRAKPGDMIQDSSGAWSKKA